MWIDRDSHGKIEGAPRISVVIQYGVQSCLSVWTFQFVVLLHV